MARLVIACGALLSALHTNFCVLAIRPGRTWPAEPQEDLHTQLQGAHPENRAHSVVEALSKTAGQKKSRKALTKQSSRRNKGTGGVVTQAIDKINIEIIAFKNVSLTETQKNALTSSCNPVVEDFVLVGCLNSFATMVKDHPAAIATVGDDGTSLVDEGENTDDDKEDEGDSEDFEDLEEGHSVPVALSKTAGQKKSRKALTQKKQPTTKRDRRSGDKGN